MRHSLAVAFVTETSASHTLAPNPRSLTGGATRTCSATTAGAVEARVSILVVGCPLVRVRESFVGVGDLRELLGGFGIVLVRIWVVPLGQLVILFLYLIFVILTTRTFKCL